MGRSGLEVLAEAGEFGFGGFVELLVEEAVDGAEFLDGVFAGGDGGAGAGGAGEACTGVLAGDAALGSEEAAHGEWGDVRF